MEERSFELPEHLILARQANLLRTFFKLVAALTAVALLLIVFLPGFATSDSVIEPFLRNSTVLACIGVLYYLVHRGFVLASIYGTIFFAGVAACYSIFMESPGNMQMMGLIVFPICIAGLLPNRPQFWLVYALNVALMFLTVWLIITYRGVELEYRSIVTIAMLQTLIALLIDTLASSYRASLTTTFNQLLQIRAAEEKLDQMDKDLGLAVSERLKAEDNSLKLARAEQLALEVAGAGAIAIDLQNHTIDISEDFLNRYGFGAGPVPFDTFLSYIHLDDRNRLEVLLTHGIDSGDRIEGDFRIAGDKPTWWMFLLEAEHGDGRLHGIVVDVTARVIEQQQLNAENTRVHESQRLESLGVLAGAIAHDFNNLLHVIMLNADLARQSLNPDSKPAVSISRVMTTVDRAAELCTELLAYSGKGKFTIEPFNVEKLVVEMRNLLDISTPKGVEIEYSSDQTNPVVNGDLTQMRQVVMNLITNAGEAIGPNSSGRINVSVATTDCNDEYFRQHQFIEKVEPGLYATIVVEDNGRGMDEQTRRRMFDPFFSTKETGHGLGLSAVLGIIRGHKGSIEVTSTVGEGTRTTLLLPLAKSDVIAVEPAVGQQQSSDRLILFVDDEAEIRTLARTVLEDAGFSIIEASDGQEAVDIFKQRHEELHLVMLDLMMPNKTGLEAYLEISDIDNSVPVVFSSGFSESEVLQKLPPKARSSFLKKPYIASDLREFVERILSPSQVSHSE